MYIGASNTILKAYNRHAHIGHLICIFFIQDGVQDNCQCMGRFKKLCKFLDFILIFFCNTSFQLFLWSASQSKLLPDNIKQYLAPLHESFQLAT